MQLVKSGQTSPSTPCSALGYLNEAFAAYLPRSDPLYPGNDLSWLRHRYSPLSPCPLPIWPHGPSVLPTLSSSLPRWPLSKTYPSFWTWLGQLFPSGTTQPTLLGTGTLLRALILAFLSRSKPPGGSLSFDCLHNTLPQSERGSL